MKNLLFVLAAVLAISFTAAAQDARGTVLADGPVMAFETTVVDYGEIAQKSEPLRTFRFMNSGSAPLVINNASGSCGCTVPSYPKEPILPGQEAEIEVRYDTNRLGVFTKSVTLTTNAVNSSSDQPEGTFVLQIKGKVNPPAPGHNPVEIQLGPK